MFENPKTATQLALAKILIADDQIESLELLGTYLQDAGYKTLLVSESGNCLHMAETEQPDLILLDIMMLEMDGFEVCQQLKTNPTTWKIPVIFLSGLTTIENKIKGFRLGAADYINKPFQLEEVLVRVNTQVHLRLMRRQLEHQNQLLQEQARQLAQRVQHSQIVSQAKSRFMAMSSHDLRQPLHALSLLLETLGSKQENAHLAVLIARIRQSINALSTLFNTLLDMSQLDAEHLQTCVETLDLNLLVAQLAEEFAEQTRSKGLQLRFADCPKAVRSNPSLLKRILQNLLSNAIRYTQQGWIAFNYQLAGEFLIIQLEDTGVGIAEDKQSLVFEEFYRIERSDIKEPGLGFGLSIVKRLADLLRHPLHLHSIPGKGTCFSLSVPWVERINEETLEDDLGSLVNGQCVALLDEDAVTLAITQELLEDWGYEVIAANNLAVLLKALEGHGIQVLVTDYQVQQMRGIQLMQQVQRQQKRLVPTLFMTTETALQQIAEMKRQGAIVLLKPVNPDRLYEVLQQLKAALPSL